jgi:hypothetical protein
MFRAETKALIRVPELSEKHPKETKDELEVLIDQILSGDGEELLLDTVLEEHLQSQVRVLNDLNTLLGGVGPLLLELLVAEQLNKVDDGDTIRHVFLQALNLHSWQKKFPS